jgi:MarR family transcriptional regulator, temperature-dependent positive regulator of motility
MTNAKTSGLDRSPLHLLHRVAQCAGNIFDRELGDADLTPRQLAVLMTVAENEGLSQTGITERTGIDRSTLADLVLRLKRKGWLERRRTKADARAYAVKLTEMGHSLLRNAMPLAKKVDQSILQALPSRGGDRFVEQLDLIVKALERKD